VDETVAVSIEKDNGRHDVTCREARGSVGAHGGTNDGRQYVIVVHLEGRVAHDLEPVHDGLDRSKGIKVCGCSDFLVRGDVGAVPIE